MLVYFILISYYLILIILTPIVPVFYWFYDKNQFLNKIGLYKSKNSRTNTLWFHVASLGEARSIVPLLKKIRRNDRTSSFLITVVRSIAKKTIENELIPRAVVHYLPFENPIFVYLFLRTFKPKKAVFVEAEIWPCLIQLTNLLGIPLYLLNARMSHKSFVKWRNFRGVIKKLLSCFTRIIVASKLDKQKYSSFYSGDLVFVGNLKDCTGPLEYNEDSLKSFNNKIVDRPVWLASSLSLGEEEIIVKAHKLLLKDFPNILLVIVPRHISVVGNMSIALDKKKIAIRSKKDELKPNIGVYLADTFGELGVFYRAVNIVFVGGSIIDGRGGQNPIEAARLGAAIMMGKYTYKIESVVRAMKRKRCLEVVKDEKAIARFVSECITNKKFLAEKVKLSREFANVENNIIEDVIKSLEI